MSAEQIVVAAAIVDAGPPARVLATQRAAPAELAGWWEFPGGKVEPGEDERAALRRECAEELDLEVTVGERIGPDVRIDPRCVLHVWTARVHRGTLSLREHRDARWLTVDELTSVRWLPVDAPVVEAVADLIAALRDCRT